jgi:antitoxin CptB
MEARRLLWRCRRGMKELDVLLERYVRSRLPEASSEERRALTGLLDLPDPLLADYLLGHATAIEPALANLVAAIRSPQGVSA